MEEKKSSNFLFKLFITFFKIGAFTFGGGFAMIPLIEKELVEINGWLTKEEFIDSISVTQSMPGAVAINLAIFLGYNQAGLPGAIMATLGVSLPSFLIILIIAVSFGQFKDNTIVESAFMGIRAAVVALIAYAGFELMKTVKWRRRLVTTLIVAAFARIRFGVSPVILILAAGLSGLVSYRIDKKMRKGN